MIENHYAFIKSTMKTQSNINDIFVIFVLQKKKNSSLFDKNCTQENVKCYIQHEDT